VSGGATTVCLLIIGPHYVRAEEGKLNAGGVLARPHSALSREPSSRRRRGWQLTPAHRHPPLLVQPSRDAHPSAGPCTSQSVQMRVQPAACHQTRGAHGVCEAITRPAGACGRPRPWRAAPATTACWPRKRARHLPSPATLAGGPRLQPLGPAAAGLRTQRPAHGRRSRCTLPIVAASAAAAGSFDGDSQRNQQPHQPTPGDSQQQQPAKQPQQQPNGQAGVPQKAGLLELPLLVATSLSHVNVRYIRMRRRRKWCAPCP